jgi:transposase InsO family protein
MLQEIVGSKPQNTSRKNRSAEFKKQVLDRANETSDLAAAKEFSVGKSTIGKWRLRYQAKGLAGLVDAGSRPHHQPKKTSQWIIDKIINLKKKSPEMGSVAVSQHLVRHENVALSAPTIAKIFKKEKLPDGDQGHAEASHFVKGDKDRRLEQTLEKELDVWERFCRPHPNDLWQMDIMSFNIRNAHQVYLISSLDDCSRMIVGWGLYRQQTADNVLEVLRTSLARYGAPKEILTDQGAQFKHWKGVTEFEKILAKLKIQHIKARPHHPQTCGKIEAYHKTIWRELIDKDFFLSQEQAIERISRFVEHYNHVRPHSALDGFTPADRYFGVIEAVKKYLQDFQKPKNETEEKQGDFGIGRGSKIYLLGKILGQEVRIQELSGRLSIHLNNQPWREVNLLQ